MHHVFIRQDFQLCTWFVHIRDAGEPNVNALLNRSLNVKESNTRISIIHLIKKGPIRKQEVLDSVAATMAGIERSTSGFVVMIFKSIVNVLMIVQERELRVSREFILGRNLK